MPTEPVTSSWVIAWVLIAVTILYRHWRHGQGVGLLLTYVFCLAALHWLAPVLHLLPWFETMRGDMTAGGLRQSTFAIAGFAIGAELVSQRRRGNDSPSTLMPESGRDSHKIINLYLVVGAALYAVVITGWQFPIATSIVSTGSTLVAVGVALKCWSALMARRTLALWLWLGLTTAFPLMTVLAQGFLGHGFVAALIVLSFVISVQPARWWHPIAGALLIFLGLSIYVTYMRDRSDIRDVVWGGERVTTRIAQLQSTFENAEWFDPWNAKHLERVDQRLNQNHLLGSAVVFINEGNVPFAAGGTLVDAVIALIPRAFWPNKPTVAGSGDIVSTYTGIRFAYGTSVGVGQVMELYVNLGTTGVFLGFVLIGALVVGVDRRAAHHLAQGDVGSFMRWYLPGLSLLQVGGAIAEVTATAAAAAALMALVNRLRRPDDVIERVPIARPGAPSTARGSEVAP